MNLYFYECWHPCSCEKQFLGAFPSEMLLTAETPWEEQFLGAFTSEMLLAAETPWGRGCSKELEELLLGLFILSGYLLSNPQIFPIVVPPYFVFYLMAFLAVLFLCICFTRMFSWELTTR
jgi:hypothetical protein